MLCLRLVLQQFAPGTQVELQHLQLSYSYSVPLYLLCSNPIDLQQYRWWGWTARDIARSFCSVLSSSLRPKRKLVAERSILFIGGTATTYQYTAAVVYAGTVVKSSCSYLPRDRVAFSGRDHPLHSVPFSLLFPDFLRVVSSHAPGNVTMIQETEVMRVLPRENEEINSEWIHDKARFSYDGLKRQRLDRPYTMLMGEDGGASLAPVTWKQGFEAVAGLLDKSVWSVACAIVAHL